MKVCFMSAFVTPTSWILAAKVHFLSPAAPSGPLFPLSPGLTTMTSACLRATSASPGAESASRSHRSPSQFSSQLGKMASFRTSRLMTSAAGSSQSEIPSSSASHTNGSRDDISSSRGSVSSSRNDITSSTSGVSRDDISGNSHDVAAMQGRLLASLFHSLLVPYFSANPTAARCMRLVADEIAEGDREEGRRVAGNEGNNGESSSGSSSSDSSSSSKTDETGLMLEKLNVGGQFTESNSAGFVDEELREWQRRIRFDHVAFRTFGAQGFGIAPLAKVFFDLGYTQRDRLVFPSKKLQAYWFSPPEQPEGATWRMPLPRVFISELQVEQLSERSQTIITSYLRHVSKSNASSLAALSCLLGQLAWPLPSSSDYEALLEESEYAAWTLVNGFSVNHTTISVHNLPPPFNDIPNLNQFLLQKGVRMNHADSLLKVSPDGGLLQSSTVADPTDFVFSDGASRRVAGAYIEFAQRKVLPCFSHLPEEEVNETHRRDGFEVANADGIFESTSLANLKS